MKIYKIIFLNIMEEQDENEFDYSYNIEMKYNIKDILYRNEIYGIIVRNVDNCAIKEYHNIIPEYNDYTVNEEMLFYDNIEKLDPDDKIPIIKSYTYYQNNDKMVYSITFPYYKYKSESIRYQYDKSKSIKCFIKQMLICLDFLHDNEIIHCDMKPSNILSTNKELTDFKLIDFGSYHTFEQIKKVDKYVTTLYYISPEQLNNNINITELTDIYSLGISILQLIQPNQFFEKIIIDEQYGNFDIKLINTKDEKLDDLLSKMLIKDPSKKT